MTALILQRDIEESIPTEGLDLCRDGLNAARVKLVAMLKDVYYLQQLARSCDQYGYALPYTSDDLRGVRDTLDTLANRVVRTQGATDALRP